ncbi:MAG: glycosyltransferase [Xenococcaceae cyanobacterium MO_167.B52]|nr:glycosyltransferase [Xenococcaceae cyanobacterium MO_167.B52]
MINEKKKGRVITLNRDIDNTKQKKRKLNVFMFGPSLSEKGGMGAVQRQILNGVSEKVTIKHASTWDGKNNTFILFTRALIFFLEKLLKGQVDLVHIHVSEGGSVVRKSILALLAFAFSKPVIMHTHGCEFHLFYNKLPRTIKQLLNKVFQNCACLIVLSKSWKNIYIEQCNLKVNQVKVLYNPVAVPQSVYDRTNLDKITFLFLGKINQRKGIFDLLHALAMLPSVTRNKIRAILAGSGEIEKAEALAKELNIESLVEFPGWVNIKQRDDFLAQANVFVLPSYNEGLPMALLEAMSWGLPVVTTPVGGITEVVTHYKTGLLVQPGSIQELAASMQILIDNESLRLSLGNAARKQASLLDTKNYSHELLNLYHSIM